MDPKADIYRLLGKLPASIEFLDAMPAIENKIIQTLFDYWLALVDEDVPPRREEIDPLEIPNVLPHIWLHEHVADSTDFRNRLTGEKIRDMYPVNSVGLLCREFIGEDAWPAVAEQYMLAINTPGVGHSIGPVYMDTIGRPGTGERLFMPLQGKDGRNSFIIGATVYTPPLHDSSAASHLTPRKTFTPLNVLIGGRP